MTTTTTPPKYQHDCDQCTHLGPFTDGDTDYDLRWCPTGGMGGPTVIARYGDDGPDYTSGLEIARWGLSPCLSEALRRAEGAGLDCGR